MFPSWHVLAAGSLGLWLAGVGAPAIRQDPPAETVPPVVTPADPFVEAPLLEVQGWARMLGKSVLIAFYEEDCAACDELDATTFADERVLAWLDGQVLALRLRPAGDYLRTRWRVLEHPTLVFLSWQDEELGRLTGPLAPQAFLDAAVAILTGADGLEHARARVAEQPADPWAHMLLARALKARKLYDELRAELLWLFDAMRGDPSWRDLREGEVLRELGLLAFGAGPVRDALVERRDASLAALLASPPPDEQGPDEAQLVLAARDMRLLNNQLGAAQQTLSTWEALRRREDRPPAVAQELFGWEVAGLLLRARRYEDLLEAMPDPLVVVQERMTELLALEAAAAETAGGGSQPQIERNRMLTEAGSLYEALLGAGNDKDAGDLAELLIAFDPGMRAYSSLLLGAKRARRLELARTHLERGLAAIEDPGERERLRRFGESALGR